MRPDGEGGEGAEAGSHPVDNKVLQGFQIRNHFGLEVVLRKTKLPMVGLRFWDTRHRVLRSPTMGNFIFLKTALRLK